MPTSFAEALAALAAPGASTLVREHPARAAAMHRAVRSGAEREAKWTGMDRQK
ncbi:hypothetical protein D9M68_395860 [compost metagenome]